MFFVIIPVAIVLWFAFWIALPKFLDGLGGDYMLSWSTLRYNDVEPLYIVGALVPPLGALFLLVAFLVRLGDRAEKLGERLQEKRKQKALPQAKVKR